MVAAVAPENDEQEIAWTAVAANAPVVAGDGILNWKHLGWKRSSE